MIYGYIRISTDKQTVENQRFEILKHVDENNLKIDEWIEETVSSKVKLVNRDLGKIVDDSKEGDVIICTELSRLGRNLMEVMTILNKLMEKDVKVFTTKEKYELGNNINSKVLAFAFSLAAEIERNMISQRTKEALDQRRNSGKKLGRPKGTLSKVVKLTGKDEIIRNYLKDRVSVSAIARILNVNRMTLSKYIETRNLKDGLEINSLKRVGKESVKKEIKLKIYVRVERNNKYVRGMKKSREEIENLLFYYYKAIKPDPEYPEYLFTMTYETDKELDREIYHLCSEIDSIADYRHCFTEQDVYEIGGDRSW